MRNLLFALAFLLSSGCYAENLESWSDNWCKGIECCSVNNLEKGIEYLSLALDRLGDNSHPEIYVDRGQALLMIDKYEEALLDFDQALKNEKLNGSDHLRCIEGRINAYAHLGRDFEWLQELDRYKQYCQTYPQVEYLDDKIIMRNMPDNKAFQKTVTNCLLEAKLIENENSIQKYSKVWIVKIMPCNCRNTSPSPEAQDRFQDAENLLRACQNWCDRVAGSGNNWCQNFSTTECQNACFFTVEFLRNQCRACCVRGTSFLECVKPFEDIAQAMINQGFTCNPDVD